VTDDQGEIDFEKLRKMEKKGIQPVKPIDHADVEYEEVEKDFYKEHPEIEALDFEQVNQLR